MARAAAVTLLAIAGLALALGLNAAGTRIGPITQAPVPSPAAVAVTADPEAAASASAQTPAPAPTPASSVEPLGALGRFFPELGAFLATTGGRLESYRNTLALIVASPVVGHGLGTLVDVPYGFGATQFDTPGKLPSVDNAYLTVGMKAGLVGMLSFAALILSPAWWLWSRTSRRARAFLLPAWIGICLLMLTQSFAVIGYSPFVLGLLIVALDRLPQRPTPQDR